MVELIGRKVGMTQLVDEKGDIVPVTVIEAGPCTVTEIRTSERDGYTALQLGFGTNKESRFIKPVLGQFKKRNLPPSRHLREFRIGDVSGYSVGQTLNVSVFEKGEHVDVEGTTKGRGFAGVIKRHGFTAGTASHGPTMGREPGSIGSSAYPSRVIKGKRLRAVWAASRSPPRISWSPVWMPSRTCCSSGVRSPVRPTAWSTSSSGADEMNAKLYALDGSEKGTTALPDELFAQPVHEQKKLTFRGELFRIMQLQSGVPSGMRNQTVALGVFNFKPSKRFDLTFGDKRSFELDNLTDQSVIASVR